MPCSYIAIEHCVSVHFDLAVIAGVVVIFLTLVSDKTSRLGICQLKDNAWQVTKRWRLADYKSLIQMTENQHRSQHNNLSVILLGMGSNHFCRLSFCNCFYFPCDQSALNSSGFTGLIIPQRLLKTSKIDRYRHENLLDCRRFCIYTIGRRSGIHLENYLPNCS